MYGLINEAVKDLVTTKFGADKWETIRQNAGAPDEFMAMHKYSDELTYKLVASASEVLGAAPEVILEGFGEYWTTYSAEAGFGHLLNFAGDSFVEFLHNLDRMHARIALTFPELDPPSFWCTDVSEGGLSLHYKSGRPGLEPVVVGMLKGLAKRFEVNVSVEMLPRRPTDDHSQFAIRFVSAEEAGADGRAAVAA